MRKTISKRIGVMTSDDDLLDNPLGNQATIINNSIVIDNLNKFRSKQNTSNITLIFVVQLRDPIRRFEAVGGPMMVLIHATSEEQLREEEKRGKKRESLANKFCTK